jgi:hypothetical protein
MRISKQGSRTPEVEIRGDDRRGVLRSLLQAFMAVLRIVWFEEDNGIVFIGELDKVLAT